MCFNSNRPTALVEKSKTGFQGGGYGGHFGFLIGMILAIFHLHVNLLLLCKFQLNSPCGLRDVQNRFSRRRLRRPSWISDRHDFSSFLSRRCPAATEQVSAQIDQRFGKRCRRLIFKMAAMWRPSWIFDRLVNFSFFVSTRRPDAHHQVSTQLDHSLKRRCTKYEFSIFFFHINVYRLYKCMGKLI